MASNPQKIRLDKRLFEDGLVESREKAKALIMGGKILVNGIVVDKAGTLVKQDDVLTVKSKMPYVSRGGIKLEHAIQYFNVDVKNKIAMDVGASTGGFTDFLLQNGAPKVYAIDVGYGQFDLKLRNDARVILLEKTNIRYLAEDMIHDEIEIAVIDVSFIQKFRSFYGVMEKLLPLSNHNLRLGKKMLVRAEL
jgi:23S rRNA (cytidine1920-2'-O)/16S rRNA (cytidine1409-2'-O)-methyltransferase